MKLKYFEKASLGVLVGFSYLLAFLYVSAFLVWLPRVFQWDGQWLFYIAFTVCFVAFGEWFARWHEVGDVSFSKSAETRFWLLCGGGFCLYFLLSFLRAHGLWFSVLGGEGIASFYPLFGLHVVAVYWVLCRFGMLSEKATSWMIGLDLLSGFVVIPFRHFFLRVQVIFSALQKVLKKRAPQKKKNIWVVLATIIVSFFFLQVAFQLLLKSDMYFMQAVEQWMSWVSFSFSLPTFFVEIWSRFLLSLPVGAYLFGLFGGCARIRKSLFEAEAIQQSAEGARVVSPNLLQGLMFLFVALYTIYFAVQGEYYFSAFRGVLPQEFTYAYYARDGFFELCKIMQLNLFVLFAAAKVTATPLRKVKALRVLALVLLVQSALFAVTAFAKLALYISVYGFTSLRLLSCWAILVMTAAVVLAGVRLFKKKPVVTKLVQFAAGSFILLCLLSIS